MLDWRRCDWEKGGLGNNGEAKKKKKGRQVASESSKASTGWWKISISHGNGSGPPCCSSDRPHLSSWHTFAIHRLLCPTLPAPLLPFSVTYTNPLSFILTDFYTVILLPKHLFNPLFCLSPLCFLFYFIFSLWQLSFDSFLLFFFFLRHSEGTAGHRGPC